MQDKLVDLSKVSNMDKLISIAESHAKLKWSEDAFDLADINHLLIDNYKPDDFNAFPAPLTTKADFRVAVAAAKEARDNPKAPWLRWACSCGNQITLSRPELTWRRQMGIDLPCMCDQCICKALGKSALG